MTESVLGVARVEFDDALECTECLDVDRHGDSGNKELETFGAWRSGQRAGVLEKRSRPEVVDNLVEDERTSCRNSAGFADTANVLERTSEQRCRAAVE